MTTLIIGLLVPVLIVGGILFLVIRRGLQIKELCENGIETDAIIESKRSVKRGANARQLKLLYRYIDSAGQTRSHTSVVNLDVYNRYDEGQPFPVTYSSKRPDISAPRYLVDQAR